jgi:hypothetical protein
MSLLEMIGFKSSAPSPVEPQKYDAIENEFDLVNFCCVVKDGITTWFVANRAGNLTQFVFNYNIQPYHESSLRDEDMSGFLGCIRDIREPERITIASSSFADPWPRVNDLRKMQENCSPEQVLLLESSVETTFRLSGYDPVTEKPDPGAKARRRKQEYSISTTYTVDPDAIEATGEYEKLLAKGEKWWKTRFTGQSSELNEADIKKMLLQARNFCLDTESKLMSKSGLPTRRKTGTEVWNEAVYKINGDDYKVDLPYYLLYNVDTGFFGEVDLKGREIIPGTRPELANLLIGELEPEPSREYLWLPHRKKYVAALGFRDIVDEWDTPEDKYKWLWNSVMSQEDISSIEIITQVGWGDPTGSLKDLQAVTDKFERDANTSEELGKTDVTAGEIVKGTHNAQRLIIQGNHPVYVGVAILVYADSLPELAEMVRKVKAPFGPPSELYQETEYAWKIFFQSMPFRIEPMWTSKDGPGPSFLKYNSDFRRKIPQSASLGAVQIVGIRSDTRPGIEFISKKGGCPVKIGFTDSLGNPWHGGVLGKAGSGKSVLAEEWVILGDALSMDQTIVDVPDNNGNSTYSKTVQYLGGAEIDTLTAHNNLMESIDVSGYEEAKQAERLALHRKTIQNVVRSLFFDNLPDLDGTLKTQVQTICPIAVNRYYDDPTIAARIKEAHKKGIGTSAWHDYPTLKDFYRFFTLEKLGLDEDEDTRRAIAFARTRLKFWIEGAMGSTIATPSSYDFSKHKLVLFSLRGLDSDEEACVYGLSAITLALRKSLTSERSRLYCDEFAVLLGYEGLADMVASAMATKRKDGIAITVALQNPGQIALCGSRIGLAGDALSSAASKLLSNISWWACGLVAPAKSAAQEYTRILGIDPDVIAVNQSESFLPNLREMSTQWLILDGALKTHCNYFASPIPLGLTLTSQEQVKARRQYFEAYPDPIEAAARFGHEVYSRFTRGENF